MFPRDEDLVGYLLDALDGEERRRVEDHLRDHPESRQRLRVLSQTLMLLEIDRDEASAPPAGLTEATLARVEGPLPQVPSHSKAAAAVKGWCRPAEAMVASLMALIIVGLGAAWAHKTRREAQRAGCADNLHVLHTALANYSDLQPDCSFPQVERKGPQAFAGVYAPVLADKGLLPDASRLVCPADDLAPPKIEANQLQLLREWYERDRQRFEKIISVLGGSYAYSLGYREEDSLQSLRRAAGMDHLPLLADRPKLDRHNMRVQDATHHGWHGQNVLFVDGSVRYVTHSAIGPNGDHIFLNQNELFRSGLHASDVVLGVSDLHPFGDY